MKEVDIVVNCYERTWRKTLSKGNILNIINQNNFTFSNRIVLINNVSEKSVVRELAEIRRSEGEIDSFYFVDEEIERAMDMLGLKSSDFGSTFFFSNWAFVAITLPGSEFLLHFDPENTIIPPYLDWITPSVDLMEDDPAVLFCSPWPIETKAEKPMEIKKSDILDEKENHLILKPIVFGDSLFLIRKSDFVSINYHERCIASLRYPLSWSEFTFEARVDSWMRHQGCKIGLVRKSFVSQPDNMGVSHPRKLIFSEKLRKFFYRQLISIIKRLPWRHKSNCLNI